MSTRLLTIAVHPEYAPRPDAFNLDCNCIDLHVAARRTQARRVLHACREALLQTVGALPPRACLDADVHFVAIPTRPLVRLAWLFAGFLSCDARPHITTMLGVAVGVTTHPVPANLALALLKALPEIALRIHEELLDLFGRKVTPQRRAVVQHAQMARSDWTCMREATELLVKARYMSHTSADHHPQRPPMRVVEHGNGGHRTHTTHTGGRYTSKRLGQNGPIPYRVVLDRTEQSITLFSRIA